MRLNADFTQSAVVIPDESHWIRSPESGVDRLMLDRIGEEVARATSIVRYAAGSKFPRHEHAKGEEFLVLEGVFSDETGDFPVGSYVRNPPGTGHAPFSVDGCRILVKLRQFEPADLRQFSVNTSDVSIWNENWKVLLLHEFGIEKVQMQRLAAGETLAIFPQWQGTEIFIVDGAIEEIGRQYGAKSWLRFPSGSDFSLTATIDSLV